MTDDDINESTDAMTAYRTGRSDGLKESKNAAFWKGFALGILATFVLYMVIWAAFAAVFGLGV